MLAKIQQNGSRDQKNEWMMVLTLLNAVLVWVLLVCLSCVGTGNALNALIEVVLRGGALLGFLAFCGVSAFSYTNFVAHRIS